ncbi:MAG TPA: RNA polymerase subunit sigma-24, partial [Thermomonospora sp.]|nr:RNA polymerase subunit sigma-24 [Thermomonospora sp.]
AERRVQEPLGGDVNRLMEVLAPEVTLWTDGGGKVRAALRVIHGADKVGRFMAGITRQEFRGVRPTDLRIERADVNGVPGLVFYNGREPFGSLTMEMDVAGRVTAIHMVANPDKLHALASGRRLNL